jgi:hypothetical protein
MVLAAMLEAAVYLFDQDAELLSRDKRSLGARFTLQACAITDHLAVMCVDWVSNQLPRDWADEPLLLCLLALCL